MSEDTSSVSETTDVVEENPDAPDGDPKAKTKEELVSKSELEKAARRRDQATERARKAEERAAELEAKVGSFDAKLKELDELKRKADEEEAVKRGDIEKLRKSAQDREAELATKIAELTASLERTKADAKAELDTFKGTYFLKNEVMRTLSEISTDPELVWMALGHHFELGEEDDGSLKPRVKDDTRDIRTFVERKLEDSNRAVLLKNHRKQGSGTETSDKTKESGKQAAVFTRAQIDAMPTLEQREFFRTNPDALKAYVAGKLQP